MPVDAAVIRAVLEVRVIVGLFKKIKGRAEDVRAPYYRLSLSLSAFYRRRSRREDIG